MALLPTAGAILLGMYLGMRWGGSPSNALEWRPVLWQLGLAGLSLLVVVDVSGLSGGWAVLLRIGALGALVAFGALNVHTGGMVLVVAGLGSNLLVTLLNWGMPVSASAMVSSGMVPDDATAASATLTGGREVAEGAWLGFLGDVIPLPWGQVLSIGDLLWLAGLVLVTASVLRRYEVRPRRRSGSYVDSISALSRGPAPRRGPGLHPSRMAGRRPGRPTR